MIRNTVKKIGEELKALVDQRVPLALAFQRLEADAKSVEAQVVLQVMREAAQELLVDPAIQHYVDSNARTARMPEMALRR